MPKHHRNSLDRNLGSTPNLGAWTPRVPCMWSLGPLKHQHHQLGIASHAWARQQMAALRTNRANLKWMTVRYTTPEEDRWVHTYVYIYIHITFIHSCMRLYLRLFIHIL